MRLCRWLIENVWIPPITTGSPRMSDKFRQTLEGIPTLTSPTACNLARTMLARLQMLSSDERTSLLACAVSRRVVQAGTDVVAQGAATDRIYFVETGWAGMARTLRDGRRQIPIVVLPGEACNLDTLAYDRAGSAVRMLTAGVVLSVPRSQLQSLFDSSPGISKALLLLGLRENAVLVERAISLGRRSAHERLAHLLCEFAVRLGQSATQGVVQFELPLTQEQLADLLGLTAVHVNRTMQQFRRDGLLSRTRKTIGIEDIAGFRAIAGFTPDYLYMPELLAAEDREPSEKAALPLSSSPSSLAL
jgi:CRP-like cAMP-binding protein